MANITSSDNYFQLFNKFFMKMKISKPKTRSILQSKYSGHN